MLRMADLAGLVPLKLRAWSPQEEESWIVPFGMSCFLFTVYISRSRPDRTPGPHRSISVWPGELRDPRGAGAYFAAGFSI